MTKYLAKCEIKEVSDNGCVSIRTDEKFFPTEQELLMYIANHPEYMAQRNVIDYPQIYDATTDRWIRE